ncbi:GNAT family N-acetyltransferase [Glycomyces sp. NPDC049804]|uniref:GNAT family N-acetyltransferase n=1 Tax=Glycomyces sp. NPDC049804 TaxID=3154363 RepID=UPI003419AC98
MTESAPLIRSATSADAAELARLRWEFKLEEEAAAPGAGEREAFVADCEAWLRARLGGGWRAWVAEAAGRVVGHVFVSVVERMPSPTGTDAPIGYVTNFFVVQEHRGRGVGARLLEAVNDHARTAPLCALIVWPSERSDPLYRRHGYGLGDGLLEQHLLHD